MWKFLLKQALKRFLEPLFVEFIKALRKLADKTYNTIDNALVDEIEANKNFILDFIRKQLQSI